MVGRGQHFSVWVVRWGLAAVLLVSLFVSFSGPPGSVQAATQTFSNPASTTIKDFPTSTPYPSTIAVSGLSGTVTKVTVTLTDLNHPFPDDIDILLVGPTGVKTVL